MILHHLAARRWKPAVEKLLADKPNTTR